MLGNAGGCVHFFWKIFRMVHGFVTTTEVGLMLLLTIDGLLDATQTVESEGRQ